MAAVVELIRKESNGTLSFGDYTLDKKSKVSDFEFEGDLYKVKTFKEITKLERNGLLVYESVPGTSVFNFKRTERDMSMTIEGLEDVQIIFELEPVNEYKVYINSTNIGKMKTNLGGKLTLSVELDPNEKADIKVVKL